jgi:hypothetical protein
MDSAAAMRELSDLYEEISGRRVESPIALWQATVDDVVANGYSMSYFDYERSVAFRTFLEFMFRELSPDARAALTPIVAELDRRFAAATIVQDPAHQPWWETAYPRRPSEELGPPPPGFRAYTQGLTTRLRRHDPVEVARLRARIRENVGLPPADA